MSWGISKRLKKILGFTEEMNLEAPWMNGIDDESQNQFSSDVLKDTRTVEQKAADNMRGIQDKLTRGPQSQRAGVEGGLRSMSTQDTNRGERVVAPGETVYKRTNQNATDR